MLAASPYVEVGAHTKTHPVMARLAPDAQAREVEMSRDGLRERTGKAIHCFAYPYGSAADYSATTVGILRQVGVTQACTTMVSATATRTTCLPSSIS